MAVTIGLFLTVYTFLGSITITSHKSLYTNGGLLCVCMCARGEQLRGMEGATGTKLTPWTRGNNAEMTKRAF